MVGGASADAGAGASASARTKPLSMADLHCQRAVEPKPKCYRIERRWSASQATVSQHPFQIAATMTRKRQAPVAILRGSTYRRPVASFQAFMMHRCYAACTLTISVYVPMSLQNYETACCRARAFLRYRYTLYVYCSQWVAGGQVYQQRARDTGVDNRSAGSSLLSLGPRTMTAPHLACVQAPAAPASLLLRQALPSCTRCAGQGSRHDSCQRQQRASGSCRKPAPIQRSVFSRCPPQTHQHSISDFWNRQQNCLHQTLLHSHPLQPS